MPALAERCTSQDGKRNVLTYPASVFAQQEEEALKGARFGARVAIRWDPTLPRGGAGTAASTYT